MTRPPAAFGFIRLLLCYYWNYTHNFQFIYTKWCTQPHERRISMISWKHNDGITVCTHSWSQWINLWPTQKSNAPTKRKCYWKIRYFQGIGSRTTRICIGLFLQIYLESDVCVSQCGNGRTMTMTTITTQRYDIDKVHDNWVDPLDISIGTHAANNYYYLKQSPSRFCFFRLFCVFGVRKRTKKNMKQERWLKRECNGNSIS